MALVNRKTRKAIRKSVKKMIKRHGPQIAAGVVGGIASTLAALSATTDEPGTNGDRSNGGRLLHRISKALKAEKVEESAKRKDSESPLGKEDAGGRDEPWSEDRAFEPTPHEAVSSRS